MSSSAEGESLPARGREPGASGRRARRAVSATPYRDGPIVLRGPFELVDGDGAPVATHRRTVALCRCGRSRLGSFCDGTHRSAGFRAGGGVAREVAPVVVVPLPTEPA